MKSRVVIVTILVFLLPSTVFGNPTTEISYAKTDLGSGRWQYTYDVQNINLASPIEEFTIWFDYTLYANLSDTSDPPVSGWDVYNWNPSIVFGSLEPGAYGAYTLGSGIDTGQTVSGFAVSFDWLGKGEPGSQFYEIINPATFETVNEDWTTLKSVSVIPAPGAFVLTVIGLGTIGFRKKHKAL